MEVKTDVKHVKHSIPLDILDDLGSRFIINVPEEERHNLVRICFQIELAHWFYLDFYCTDENSQLQSCGMQEFATHIFQHVPFLRPHLGNLSNILDQWREYKQSVPTYGAIILSEDYSHVLLVQSYWTKSSWGFPKGKVNEDEDPSHCATREVLEETGFDITSLIDKNEFIESQINDQLVRLYIIAGVNRNTKFQPKTRNEIKAVEWFPLSDLPMSKKDNTPKMKMGVSANAFFMVLPFVKRLKRWVYEKTQKGSQPTSSRRSRNTKSMSDCDQQTKKVGKQMFSQAIKTEIEEFEKMKLKNAPRQKRHEKNKPNFKRQLFDNTKSSEQVFTAPSWLNFKLNRQAILECLP